MILYYKVVIEVGLGVSVKLIKVVEVVTYQGIIGVIIGYYYLKVIRVYYLARTVRGY